MSESSSNCSGSQNYGKFSEQYLDRFKDWNEISEINRRTKDAIKLIDSRVLKNVARTGEQVKLDGTRIKFQEGKFFCRILDQDHISHFDCAFCPVIQCMAQPHINAITCKDHMKEHNETWQKLIHAPAYSDEASSSPEPPESPAYNDFRRESLSPIRPLPNYCDVYFHKMGDADCETNSTPEEGRNSNYDNFFNFGGATSPLPNNNQRSVYDDDNFQDKYRKPQNKQPAPAANSRSVPPKKHKPDFITI